MLAFALAARDIYANGTNPDVEEISLTCENPNGGWAGGPVMLEHLKHVSYLGLFILANIHYVHCS